MRSRFRMAAGVFAFAAFFISNLNAQVSLQSKLFEEKNVKAGETYEIKLVVFNSSKQPVEILIHKLDYLFKNNRHHFLSPGKLECSNADWIKVEHSRMLLLAREKITLSFPITVPLNVQTGTYHSILGIETKLGEINRKEGRIQVGLNMRYNVQVVSNVNSEKARKELKIVGVRVKDNKLILTVRNIGEQIIRFDIIPPIPRIQFNKKIRIYPNNERIVELDITELPDGKYKKLRFLLDNGKDFIQPVFISFIKGELPERAELYYLKGEKLREERKRRPTFLPRVFAVLSYGSNFKSVSLSGSMNLFKNLILLRAGSNYREFDNFISDKILTNRIGTSLNLKNFRATYSAYFFEDSVFEMVGANYHLKNFNINCNYMPQRKLLQGNIRQQFWRRWSINFYGIYDFKLERKRYSVSLMIPIL